MRSDFNNPFSALPQPYNVRLGGGLDDIYFGMLGSLTLQWLDRVEKAATPLTAAFNRSCRGAWMRQSLVNAEQNLGMEGDPAASLEKRLLTLAEAGQAKGYKMDKWESVVPRLKSIEASAPKEEGGIKRAATVRAAMRNKPRH